MWELAGAAIIVVSTVYIARREAGMRKPPTPAPVEAPVAEAVAAATDSAHREERGKE
jgi:hypothetical protein